MKINKNYLEKFVKKASLLSSIPTINMNFTETGLESAITSASKMALTITHLDKEKFTDYSPIGEIFIKNTNYLLKVIKGYDDEIELEKMGEYTLKLSDKTDEDFIILGADIACDNIHKKGPLDIKTTAKVVLNKSDLVKPVKAMIDLSCPFVTLVLKDDKFKFKIGNKDETDTANRSILDAPKEGEGKVKVGEYFIKTYGVLEGKATFEFGTEMPLLVTEETDGIQFKCYIAPNIGK